MAVHDRAGERARPGDLVDVARLVTAYYTEHPDPDDPDQRVAFGTSGHRGSSLRTRVQRRPHRRDQPGDLPTTARAAGIDGPLFLAKDTHALSEPAWATALEVFAANDVTVLVDSRDRYTPTPALSHAVLTYNRGRTRRARATASSSRPRTTRPRDGGFKYNPPHGGPAGSDAHRADPGRAPTRTSPPGSPACAASRWPGPGRPTPPAPTTSSRRTSTTCPSVLDLDAIRAAGVRIGADPLGGASVDYWGEIAERHRLDLTVVNPLVDPTWRFMTLDWDGKIRMDCSSPYAMASLIEAADAYQVSTGNDADADRHGIVTPDAGLLNPNHYLAVAIEHLLTAPRRLAGRRGDRQDAGQLQHDRPGRRAASAAGCVEVPVGFKWFVPGLLDGVGRVRRRGVGRRVVPAPRRHASGRPTRTASCCACWPPRSRRSPASTPSERYAALTARYGEPVVRPGRRPGRPREQKAALGRAVRRPGARRPSWPGEPITAASPRRPATAPPSAGSRWSPRTAGSPPARPAPRTSTRSTPRASRDRTTWPGCRTRRASWSARCCDEVRRRSRCVTASASPTSTAPAIASSQ